MKSLVWLALFVMLLGAALIRAHPGSAQVPSSAACFRVAYATFLGGPEGLDYEEAREAIPYPDGSVLIGAMVKSKDLPVSEGPFQKQYAGDDPSLGHPGVYGGDCYIGRVSSDGSKMLCATYFGGSKQERNTYGLELDRAGNIVLTTGTRSTDIPTTPGAFQAQGPGFVVAKLSGDCTRLVWCTYLGGKGDEEVRSLAWGPDGALYVVGGTSSPDFPVTPGALQTKFGGGSDAFIMKLVPNR